VWRFVYNNEAISKKLQEAGDSVGERLWRYRFGMSTNKILKVILQM
jgi:leucyl aminopeptidase